MKHLITLGILLCSFFCLSQNQNNWWFFGQNAGLNFTANSVSPVTGQLVTFEGSAAISDVCGDLLFYTDGSEVYDRNGVIMPNGSDLLGDSSSTQSAIIVPQPENPNIYYVFTVGRSRTLIGLNYSVVDMTLNNGNGDVIPSQKNINLLSNCAEKVFATQHANGTDAWIVAYGESIPNTEIYDRFHAFKLTPNGLDVNAVVETSSVGTRVSFDARGYLRISKDGGQIIMTTPGIVDINNPSFAGRGAWLLNFNNATGTVSGPQRLQFTNGLYAYGCEFSEDGSKIYLDLNTADGGIQQSNNGGVGERTLLQYDLNQPNFASTPTTIFQTSPTDPTDDLARGALQRGLNDKIYYPRGNTPWLSVIDNPNLAGTACNFIELGQQLLPGTLATEGLPPYYNFEFEPSIRVGIGCSGLPSQFFTDPIGQCANSQVSWDFGDPSSGNNNSNEANPTHTYDNAGTYTVTLSITTPAQNYVVTRVIQIPQAPSANPIQPKFYCDDSTNTGAITINLDEIYQEVLGTQSSNVFEASIHNTRENAEQDQNALGSSDTVNSGTYFARVDRLDGANCFEIQSFEIEIIPFIKVEPIEDQLLCDGPENDGVEVFDLLEIAEQSLIDIDGGVLDITFYDDLLNAQNGVAGISLPYENQQRREEIFVRYEYKTQPTCPVFQSFFIEVNAFPEIPFFETYLICDYSSDDGVEAFDLDFFFADQVQAANSEPMNVSFHANEEEAINNELPLTNPYFNEELTERLWMRVENSANPECALVEPVDIEVGVLPLVTEQDIVVKCPEDRVALTAISGYDQYLWSNGADVASIEVLDYGSYTVEIIDFNGCSNSATIEVVPFDEIEITNLEVTQFRVNRNSIEVSVRNGGPWTYSLDNFVYQESPRFENLVPGTYTIYVRGENACDTATTTATIVGAKPFFTPNDDGFNDYWQVTEIDSIPEARIFVFDRFGKLLKQLDPLGPGWDGNFNGNAMPSTDYWYLVELPDGQNFKGHFTLKR